MARIFLALFFGIIAATLSSHVAGQTDWPRFHGENGTGVNLTADLPGAWTADQYDWQIDLPDVGSSSPIVKGGSIFLTTSDRDTAELTVRCFAASDGHAIWDKTYRSAKYPLHANNTFASSTMAADEDQIYVALANENNTWLIALDHGGNERWKRDFGPYVSEHGFGMSPVVFGDMVILVNSQQTKQLKPGQSPGDSHIFAVRKHDGTEAWTTPITNQRVCYAVPCIYQTGDGVASLINASTVLGFYSLNLDDGSVNWTTPGTFRHRIVSSPVIVGDLVLVTEGSGGGGNTLVAMKLDADNSKTPAREIYRIPQACYVPSPVVVGDLLYLFTDKGILSCHDLATGRRHYRRRIGGAFSGSPVATARHVYCVADNGDIHVVDVGKTFSHRIADQLNDTARSTPGIAENRIYFRTATKLFALSNAAKANDADPNKNAAVQPGE